MHVGIGEAEAGGVLAAMADGAIDGLEGGFGEHAVVAETLDVEQAAIGGKADLAQSGQVDQAPADGEVAGVIDRGLGPQRAAFLMVLLTNQSVS